jgi:hypothetical protein
MAASDAFRRLALSLPNVIESSHMNHPDFRVLCPDNKLRIFATLSGEAICRGVVNLTLDQQAAFCEELPEVFTPVPGGWGRMGMTYVPLETATEDTLLGALTTAHRNVLAKAATLKSNRTAAKSVKASSKPASKSRKQPKSRAQPKIKS